MPNNRFPKMLPKRRTLGSVTFDEFKRRDADALVKAHLYDTFSQIKRETNVYLKNIFSNTFL